MRPVMKRGRSFTKRSMGWPEIARPSVSRSPRSRTRVGPLGLIRRRGAHRLGHVRGRQAEDVVLAGFVRLAVLLAERERRIEAVHERGAVRREAVEAAGLDQRLEHAAVDLRQIEAAAQILEAGEVAMRAALVDDGLDRALAHALDGAEAVTNGLVVDHRECV